MARDLEQWQREALERGVSEEEVDRRRHHLERIEATAIEAVDNVYRVRTAFASSLRFDDETAGEAYIEIATRGSIFAGIERFIDTVAPAQHYLEEVEDDG